jgi:hypothetical protein
VPNAKQKALRSAPGAEQGCQPRHSTLHFLATRITSISETAAGTWRPKFSALSIFSSLPLTWRVNLIWPCPILRSEYVLNCRFRLPGVCIKLS